MPLYTYKCSKCGHETEILVVGARGEPRKCPKCGGKKLERKFGRFSCGGSGSGKPTGTSSCSATSCAPT
jgi:putative FmdB family regulatory protein